MKNILSRLFHINFLFKAYRNRIWCIAVLCSHSLLLFTSTLYAITPQTSPTPTTTFTPTTTVTATTTVPATPTPQPPTVTTGEATVNCDAFNTCLAGNYCIGEVLGILKRKLNSKSERVLNSKQNRLNITADGYLIVINRLNWKLDNKRLIIYDLPLSKYYTESIAFVKKYDIDYVDALILNHLMRSNDYDLFVTDDKKLKTAADECKVLCWYLRDICPQA